MQKNVNININPESRELTVLADQCHGQITIPDGIDFTDQITLSALAIIALTPMARKIVAHQPWFGEVVADSSVRHFIEMAHATYSSQAEPDSDQEEGHFLNHTDGMHKQAAPSKRRGLQRQTVMRGELCITHSDTSLNVAIGGEHFQTQIPCDLDELSDREALGFAAIAMLPQADSIDFCIDTLPPDVCEALATIERYRNTLHRFPT